MTYESRGASRARRRFAAFTFGLALAGLARAATAEEMGGQLYGRYCSACHGPGGKGDGIVGQLMTPRPIDLTQLAKNAGGKFPTYDVIRRIDGRETVRAHGSPDMPVWGEIFHAEEGQATEAQAISRAKSVLIANYLESIQEK